jgi:hypothetical protein
MRVRVEGDAARIGQMPEAVSLSREFHQMAERLDLPERERMIRRVRRREMGINSNEIEGRRIPQPLEQLERCARPHAGPVHPCVYFEMDAASLLQPLAFFRR